jgi:hypothetical protein
MKPHEIHRRECLQGLALALLAPTCMTCSLGARAEFPSGTIKQRSQEGAETEVPESRNSGQYGCAVGLSAAKAMLGNAINLTPTSGHRALDYYMPIEAGILSQMYEVQPGFGFLNDYQGANAYAMPESLIAGTRGTVVFGVRLLRQEGTGKDWNAATSAMVGIMAHEWGHILEFDHGLYGSPSKPMELAADFMAGWYVGWKVANGMPTMRPRAVAKSMEAKGDFDFNNPRHHGTPAERLNAMEKGFNSYVTRGVLAAARAFAIARSTYSL